MSKSSLHTYLRTPIESTYVNEWWAHSIDAAKRAKQARKREKEDRGRSLVAAEGVGVGEGRVQLDGPLEELSYIAGQRGVVIQSMDGIVQACVHAYVHMRTYIP